MDEYALLVSGSLKLKGEKKNKKTKDKRKRAHESDEAGPSESQLDERAEDAEEHGTWWKATTTEHIRGDIAIEFIPHCYAKALGNGKIVLGEPHAPGDGPDEDEIFTALPAGANQISIKSGFEKYLTIDKKQRLMGLSDAVGEREVFLPVFEDSRVALCAHNDCFLSPNQPVGHDDKSSSSSSSSGSSRQQLVAKSDQVGPNEVCCIRLNHDPETLRRLEREASSAKLSVMKGHEILDKTVKNELSHMKRASAKHALASLSMEEERKRIRKARDEGQLYEALLDTRTKIKSDKYCK